MRRARFILPLLLATVATTATAQQADTAKAGKTGFGTYVPGVGFKIADTEHGDLNFKLFTYLRYLNQLGTDDSYTDSFGHERPVQRRQDIQLQKMNIQFLGWLLSPKFRYLAYVWTSNTSLGQVSQVVVGGNLHYRFNEHITLGAGIGALPGVRSTEGNFPYWLGVDNRLTSDEFFRPSYTTGIWARGAIVRGLDYYVMLGNNLSQFGVDAGQMDNSMDTWAFSLTWKPTTGEYGKTGGFGDFEQHDRLATRIGAHFTRSDENRQSQPNTESVENSQIRLSDGNVIFTPGLFGDGIVVSDVTYQMTSADAGAKWRGFSLEGEYYWRLVNNVRGPGTEGLGDFNDHGFQLQASAMLVPKLVQAYAGGAKIFGEYGDPSEFRAGVNWFPFRNEVVRWNLQWIQVSHSPVGSLSHPYTVGSNGSIVQMDFQINF